MRSPPLFFSVVLAAALASTSSAAQRTCGVLDGPGCARVCGVLDGPGCISEDQLTFSENFQVTIGTRAGADAKKPDGDLNSLRDLRTALHACWKPPMPDEALAGMQMSVRLAFNSAGQLMGRPRITFATPTASPRVREVYFDAITQSLQACAPLSFTKGLAGAIAGRPIFIRIIHDRDPKKR